MRNLEDFLNFLRTDFHGQANLFRSGLTAVFLKQPAVLTHQLVDGLNHVHRDTNGSCLVGDRPSDGLSDPPGGISAELVTLSVVELLNRTDEADVTLLDHIQKGHPSSDVFLGYADHQPQVGLGQTGLGAFALGVNPPEVGAEKRV